MDIKNLFKSSFDELKSTKAIILMGLFIAIGIVIDRFSISFGQIFKLEFNFIIKAISGMLFGPFYNGVLGAVSDIVNHFISGQGVFHLGWTLSSVLSGVIYGYFLYFKNFNIYNKKELLIRIILAKLIISVFINILLGTFWISTTNGKAYIPLLIPRVIKEIVIIPVQIIILYYILNIIAKLKQKNKI